MCVGVWENLSNLLNICECIYLYNLTLLNMESKVTNDMTILFILSQKKQQNKTITTKLNCTV